MQVEDPCTCLMARRSRESTTREWPCTSRHAPGRMKRAPSSAMVARALTEVAANDRPLCAAQGLLHRMQKTSKRQSEEPPKLCNACARSHKGAAEGHAIPLIAKLILLMLRYVRSGPSLGQSHSLKIPTDRQ